MGLFLRLFVISLFLDLPQKFTAPKIFLYVFVQHPLVSFQRQYIILPFFFDFLCYCRLGSHGVDCHYLAFDPYFIQQLRDCRNFITFSSTAFCPRLKPSSLLHAETMWDGFFPSLLLEHMVFPSMQMIFFSSSPSFFV